MAPNISKQKVQKKRSGFLGGGFAFNLQQEIIIQIKCVFYMKCDLKPKKHPKKLSIRIQSRYNGHK